MWNMELVWTLVEIYTEQCLYRGDRIKPVMEIVPRISRSGTETLWSAKPPAYLYPTKNHTDNYVAGYPGSN